LHLSKADQAQHRDEHRADPVFGFRSSDSFWVQQAVYDTYIKTSAECIQTTTAEHAPWHIIEGADDNYRRATTLIILRDAITAHLKERRKKTKAAEKAVKQESQKARKKKSFGKLKRGNVLRSVDLSRAVDTDAYKAAFKDAQGRLYEAQKLAREAKLSTVLAFEGWDAAGKGGAIRRLTYAMSAYNYTIVPIAAPTDEERAHHYLWRFWRHLERAGQMTIFDRSWYGRVLVERAENLISKQAWRRAYGEINEFEDQLTEHGILVQKFWLHIDSDEQLKRFKQRQKIPYKRWKLTDDDWRNRKKWDLYADAVHDMVT
ncbi:MAG: polyphosphate kinase, partial [Rhodospirillaceae bacterium]